MGLSAIDISKLSAAERLDLIERLWNSLREDDLELSEVQRAELDRRNDELDADVAAGKALGVPCMTPRRESSRRSRDAP